MEKGKIYLIPNLLGDSNHEDTIPQHIPSLVFGIKYFIVENLRTTRRFLKKLKKEINIDELKFYELNKFTNPMDIESFLKPATEGHDIGIISEAGVPGVADPGADVIRIAHQIDIQVIPLVGPSSLLLALMASGLNGQNFAFNGYLPINKSERFHKIRFFEKRSKHEKQSQLFIETPYRNNTLLDNFLAACQPNTSLCIAVDITLETEFIKTKTIQEWKNGKPDLHKRPCIFIIQSSF
jgi:16S rRNA (cytidine1402-2'-O)-methyltransferase